MKKCQLYLYNDIIYMIPTASSGKMYSQIIEPFLFESLNEHELVIGDRFFECLDNCIIEKIDTNSMDTFKKLLDVTKLKSNKKLISKAKYIHVTYTGDEYIFNPVGANLQHRAFMEKLPIQNKIIQEAHIDSFKVGKLIRDLFLELQIPTHPTV